MDFFASKKAAALAARVDELEAQAARQRREAMEAQVQSTAQADAYNCMILKLEEEVETRADERDAFRELYDAAERQIAEYQQQLERLASGSGAADGVAMGFSTTWTARRSRARRGLSISFDRKRQTDDGVEYKTFRYFSIHY